MQPGPPFNGYLLHKLVMERSHTSVQYLVTATERFWTGRSLEINRTNAIEHNTPLHLAVALGDNKMVSVSNRPTGVYCVGNIFYYAKFYCYRK